MLPEKQVLGSKHSARRGQRAQKSQRVGEAINKDREEDCKELEKGHDSTH